MRIINRFGFVGVMGRTLRQGFCNYRYPYNINKEDSANYLKKVEKAEKELKQADRTNIIPRRQRRVYDKPKHDRDLTNYYVWRVFNPQEQLYKFWAHGSSIAAKLYLQPKWVIHALGMGHTPLNHYKSVSLEFSFEDNNFSKFLLYEYRNTTTYTPNIQGYDYNNQEKLPVKRRKIFRLSPEEFWKSQEVFEFRLNCSDYAEKFKFKRWVEETIQASKSKQSYDDFINKKYGPVLTYNNKQEAKNYEPPKAALLSLTPLHYNTPKKGQKFKQPKVQLPKRLGEQHRILRKRTEAQIEQRQEKAETSN